SRQRGIDKCVRAEIEGGEIAVEDIDAAERGIGGVRRVCARLIASPVYTVPSAPLFWTKAVRALPAGRPSQAEIVPFKLAKMKRANVPSVPSSCATGNESGLVLLTWPVGPCGAGGSVVGMATKPAGLTLTLVTVVLSVTA